MRKPAWDILWQNQRARFFGAILCLAGAIALARVAVMAQGLDPWRDFWIIFLFALVLLWAALATFMARDKSAAAVSSENIEAHLNNWLLRFRLGNQKLADSSSYRFAYRVTAPDGQVIIISRPATLDNYLRYRTDLTILDRHRRALNDLGESGRRRFMLEYMAESARARVHVTSARALPLTVRIERTLPITRDLDGRDLWTALEAMQQDVVIAATHVDLCIERARELKDGLTAPVRAESAADISAEAEPWAHEAPSERSRTEV